MRKKFIFSFFITSLCLVFAACNSSSGGNQHVHHCSNDKWFSDSDSHWQICDDDLQNFNVGYHSWNEGTIVKQATCTEDGIKTFTCNVCGKTKTETINATGHDYSGDWVTDENYHWHTCSHGDSTTTKEPHTWDGGTQTKAPSHFEAGNIEYKCLVCKRIKNVEIPKENHIPDSVYHTDETYHWYECIIDGEKINKEVHSFDDGTIITPATCVSDGAILYRCTKCGFSKEISIGATGHTSSLWHHDEDGHWKVCDSDGVIFSQGNHNFDTGRITKQPTCESEGEKTYTCQTCGYTRKEIIERHKNASDLINDVGSFKVCSDCNEVLKANHYHDYTETESNNTYTFKCKICNHTTTRPVSDYSFTFATRGGNTYYYKLTNIIGDSLIVPKTHEGLEVDPVKMTIPSNSSYIHFNNNKVNQSTLSDQYVNFGSSLKYIYLNSGFSSINYNNFADSTNLLWIDFPSTVTSIGEKAFRNTNLSTINIPATLTTVSANAFGDSMRLKTINIRGEEHSIANHAFCNLPVLEAINFEYAIGSIFYMTQSDSYYYGTTMNDLTLRAKYYTAYSTEDYQASQYACPSTFWPNTFKKITIEKGNTDGVTRSFKFMSYIPGFKIEYLNEFHPKTIASSSLCFSPHIDNLFTDKLTSIGSYGLQGYTSSSVYIPLSCKTISDYAVLPTGGRIYCEAERALSGWSTNWNKPYDYDFPYKNQTVTWNYQYGG